MVAELSENGTWTRGYVYQGGGELLAIQSNNQVNWVHEDAITKSQRVTNINGGVIQNGVVELDPWGANTSRSSSASAFQPHQISGYTVDSNGGADAMARRYNVSGRFAQPDPYGGSYDFSDPQSLNRYAYAGNDPVNGSDPSGLDVCLPFIGCIGSPVIRTYTLEARSATVPAWITSGGYSGGMSLRPHYVVEPHERDHGGDSGGQNPAKVDPSKRLADAFGELSRRIHADQGKNSCADFFGGIKKAEKALANMMRSTSFNSDEDTRVQAVTTPNLKQTMINTNSAFMDNSGSVDIPLSVRGDYITADNIQNAAFTVAHELGHRTKRLIPDDAKSDPTGIKSLTNNGTIYDACFSDIALKQGGRITSP